MKRISTLVLLSSLLLPLSAVAQNRGHDNRDNSNHSEHRNDRDYKSYRNYDNHRDNSYRSYRNYDDRHDWNRNYNRSWRGNFHYDDYDRWRTGQWRQANHNGRYGWWWIVGGSWYFYPQPIYPYPVMNVPPTYYVPGSPVANNIRYYCPSTQNYYPYTSVCRVPWERIVVGY